LRVIRALYPCLLDPPLPVVSQKVKPQAILRFRDL